MVSAAPVASVDVMRLPDRLRRSNSSANRFDRFAELGTITQAARHRGLGASHSSPWSPTWTSSGRHRAIARSRSNSLAALVEPVKVVLLDCDGPLCRLFGARAAARIAAELREMLAFHGIEIAADLAQADSPGVLRRRGGWLRSWPPTSRARCASRRSRLRPMPIRYSKASKWC